MLRLIKKLPFLLIFFVFVFGTSMILGQKVRPKENLLVKPDPPLKYTEILTGLLSGYARASAKQKALAIQRLISDVKIRRIEDPLTVDIEALLREAGAPEPLIAAIRFNAPLLAPSKPVAAPVQQDHIFFQKRADASFAKGDFSGALADYDRAVGMIEPVSVSIFLNRGRSNYGLNNYAIAVADLDRVIALDPSNAKALHVRGLCFEKQDQLDKAISDIRKAANIAPADIAIMADLTRLISIKDTAAAAAAAFATRPKLTRQASAVYPKNAKEMKVEGLVEVEVSVDAKGKVVSATALSGNAMLRRAAEDAARKSKFEAAKVAGKPVGGKITLTYKFP